MAVNAYVDETHAQAASAAAETTVEVSADEGIQVTAHVMADSPIEVQTAEQPPATASVDPVTVIPEVSYWSSIMDKPFNTVDGETLSTEGGVLRFKTGSYEDLSDLPSIEGIKLVDDKTFAELGMEECSILDIEKMFT